MEIWHNPRCKKSRETLQLIQDAGKNVKVVEYLKTPPDEAAIKRVLEMLEIPAEQLVRKGEEVYKTNYKGKEMTDEEWVKAMAEHPKLIERPVVIEGDQAIIGRPPEKVKALL